jgi:hypothetical protein
MKITVFCDGMRCSLVDMFRGSLNLQGKRKQMETALSSEMLVTTYQTIWHHITDDMLHSYCCKNLKFRMSVAVQPYFAIPTNLSLSIQSNDNWASVLQYTCIVQVKIKVNLSLCLTDYALRHEGVWGSGCIDPRFLDLGTSWR